MALIKDFKHDIFISYAHADNLNGPAGNHQNGWVVSFAKRLKRTLSDTLKHEINATGRQLEIYWDEQIAKGEPLEWQLNPAVKTSAIFLMIMSDHYLASEWCIQEATWFFENTGNREYSLARSRLAKIMPAFVVSVAKTSETRWPSYQILRNTPPFVFYDANRHNVDPRYAYPSIDLNTNDVPFYHEFNNLQTALTNCVKKSLAVEKPVELPRRDGEQQLSQSDVTIVATDDMVRKARRLVADCAAKNVAARILDTADSKNDTGVPGSRAVVLLLGMFPGTDSTNAVDLFRRVLEEARSNRVETISWMQPGRSAAMVDDDFEEYSEFLNEIGADIQQFDFAEFPGKFARVAEDRGDIPHSNKLKLFIDAAKVDHSIARELKAIIDSKGLNFRTFVPSIEASQKKYNEEWVKVVGRCDGVILVYGEVDIDAIDDKLDEVEKLSVKRKSINQGEISIAIVDAPPLSSIDLSAPNVRMISVESDLDVEKIMEFITDLSRRAGAPAAP